MIRKELVVAIEKKTVSLYQIDNERLILKDFDCINLGKKFSCVEMSHVCYKKRNYVLIFGNERDSLKSYFKCIVFEFKMMSLLFIKKSILYKQEIFYPCILIDHYPEIIDEQFLLICGGASDSQLHNYNYHALQVHLHILLSDWLKYPHEQTKKI